MFNIEIPIHASDKDILEAVVEGKAFAYHKTLPQEDWQEHCAVNLVFKERRAAENFIDRRI